MHNCIIQLCTVLSLGPQPIGVQCLLTSSLGEFSGYWDSLEYPPALVCMHSLLPFLLPYLGVFPFTLYLPLDFIRVSSLRPTYLHPFGRPFTYSNFCPGWGRTLNLDNRALHEPMQKNKSQNFQSLPLPCCDER